MKKFLIALAVVVTMLFSGVAIAEDAVADTTNWWDDISNLSSLKAGYIGINADENELIIDGAEGVTWDMCVSTSVATWDRFDVDLGVSEAGVGFVAVTTDIGTLDDIGLVDIPGSQFITFNVGAFVGKDFDGSDDGIEYGNNWLFGVVANVVGW